MADTAVGGQKGHTKHLKEKPFRNRQQDQMDDSQDSLDLDRPESPLRMNRDDVLAVLGYRSEHVPKPALAVGFGQRSDLCHRCGKKVYQVERIDIGELYHRGCFKCFVCGIQLSLKTFQRVTTDVAKEVYCRPHTPKVEKSISKDSIGIRSAVEAQKKASEKVFKPYEQSAYKYDPEALEFQHARQLKQRQKVKRRSSLKTHADFEKFGVFEAQADLEKRHRMEEDELYRQIFEERQRLMRNLEEVLSKEKEHTVKELVAWFEQQGSSNKEREDGLHKLEQYYLQQREKQIKQLLEGMAVEERAAVDRMVEKHAQEMLFLIDEKEREVEEKLGSNREDRIMQDAYKFLTKSSKLKIENKLKGQEEEPEDEEGEEEQDEEQEEQESQEEEEEEEMKEEDVEEEEEENEEYPEASGGHPEAQQDDKESDVGEDTERVMRGYGKPEAGGLSEVTKVQTDEQTKDGFEGMDEYRTDESGEMDESNHTNVAVAFETPANIEVHRLKSVPHQVKDKTRMESKTTQHTPPEGTDEETQTYFPVPKQRSISQTSDASHLSSKRVGAAEKQRSAGSPQARKEGTRPLGSQFQITISTERIANDQNRRNETPVSRSTKSTPLKTSSEKSPQEIKGKMTVPVNEEIDDDDEPVQMSAQPNAQPPVCRKSKLYKTPEIFREFDKHAIEEAKKDPVSFTDLVRRLSQKCQTDLQKVRAIFRWITAKDLNKMKFTEDESSDSPMGLLKGIKYGTESYHNLFKRLCSYAGLHCKIIDGFSKGAGYRPGSKFKGNRFRNQWTAVWVDDSWRFINCNWGARHVKGARDDQMTYKIDEFYFLTDPEEHIYQHFPDDPKWQLLRQPLTLEEFVRLPVVKSPFFNNQLDFVTKTDFILKAMEGRVELRLRIPKLMSFAVKLKARDKSVRHEILRDCSLIRMVNDHVVFLVDLPSPGQFYCEIFVDSDWSSESLDNACSFLLHCSRISNHRMYPQIGCFGRTPICEMHEIFEGTDIDPLVVSSGELTIAFKVPKQTLRLSHSLRFWNPRDQALVDLDRYAFLRSRLDSTVTFTIHCPNKGMYVLSLLLLDARGSKSAPVVFYRYLIDCVAGVANARPLPHSSSKWHGCRLVEPIRGELLSNTEVQFRVESRSATEVVGSVGGQWRALRRNSQNIWQAVISTGEKSGKLGLYGRFEFSKDKYIPLWEFVVKEETVVDEVRTLFKYL